MDRPSKFTRPVLFILLSLLVSSISFAVESKSSRPAVKSDLVGVWEVVSIQPVLDKKDPVFYSNQRYVFNSNSSMKYMVSEEPFSKEWLTKFQKQTADINYLIDEKGLMTMTWQSRAHSESVLCAFVLRDVPSEIAAKLPQSRREGLPKKNDLTLSFFNQKGKIVYQKVLRKIA